MNQSLKGSCKVSNNSSLSLLIKKEINAMDLGAAAGSKLGLTTANWSSKLLPSKGKRYPIQIQSNLSDQWTEKHENNE